MFQSFLLYSINGSTKRIRAIDRRDAVKQYVQQGGNTREIRSVFKVSQ